MEKKNNEKMPEVWNMIADELAVKVAAAYARNHGILACYKLVPKALSKGRFPEIKPSVVSADQSTEIFRVR